MIWKNHLTIEQINQSSPHSMAAALGIEFTEVGDDFLAATMPADHRTVQPYRILHGGANVALAETLGSIASLMCIDPNSHKVPVGVEINANHLSAVQEGGKVKGIVRPLRVGRTIHVWNIEIYDDRGKLSCVSRLTVSIIDKK